MKLYTNVAYGFCEVLALLEFLTRPLISFLFLPEANPMRTEVTYFKTPASIRIYSKLRLHEPSRVWHRNYTFNTKPYHTIRLVVHCYRVLFPTSRYFALEISRNARIFTTQNKNRTLQWASLCRFNALKELSILFL